MAITRQIDIISLPTDFFCIISANVEKKSELMTSDPEYYPLQITMKGYAGSSILDGLFPVEHSVFVGPAKKGKYTNKAIYKALQAISGTMLSDLFSELFKAIDEESQVKGID